MEEVDLGDAPSPRHARLGSTDSEASAELLDEPHEPGVDAQEGLSQRLRESLHRRVTPLVGNLRHSISTSTGADVKLTARDKLRTAMLRLRGRSESHADDSDDDARRTTQLRSSLATSGLQLVHEERLVFLGDTPLVQPQDDVLFLERSAAPDATTAWTTMRRGDFVRVQCSEDRSQSWLCQVAVDKLYSDSDALPLVSPFPGSLLPDAVVHFVPRACLPPQLAPPEGMYDDDDDDVAELRSSVDAWRPSMDDPADSTDDETATTPSSSRASVARDKAAAFYETLKTRKARLRSSSADYKDKLKLVSKEKLAVASQVSLQKLAAASQVSKEKLAVASQASKEKLAVASQASKEKLAVAKEASIERLTVAREASIEKLAVASQASKEKLAVAGQASKLKMQSWTSSFKAKMAQRGEQKPGNDSPGSATAEATTTVLAPVFTIEDPEDPEEQELTSTTPIEIRREEEQLRREMDDC